MKRFRVMMPVVLVLALVFGQVGTALAAHPTDGHPGHPESARKIVVFKDRLDTPGKDKILARAGAIKVKDLPLVNACAIMVTPAAEKALLSQAEVLRIDVDALVEIDAKAVAAPPVEQLPWGIDKIDADLVWGEGGLPAVSKPNVGSGVKVAILDTGIDLDHPDLQANIKGGVNTINPRKSADDDNGHGTHVAGIVAALDNTVGVIGAAPGVSLFAVKVLNNRGTGYTSDIIEGIEWCINNGIQVMNMSFSTSTDVQSMHDALIAAYNKGTVLVAAAGNAGPADDTVRYPAKYPEVIAVAATDQNDVLASFSSRGPEVDLAAPGVSINSTYKGSTYKVLSGTSMACPHVAATAALVIASAVTDSNGDGRINDEVREKLVSTAVKLSSYAFGRVNAYAATQP